MHKEKHLQKAGKYSKIKGFREKEKVRRYINKNRIPVAETTEYGSVCSCLKIKASKRKR